MKVIAFCPGHVTVAMIQIVPLNAGEQSTYTVLEDLKKLEICQTYMYIAKHNVVQKVHTFLKQQLFCS